MAEALGSIFVKLGADDAALRAGLARASASVKQFGKDVQDAGRSIRDNIGVPLAAFGTAAVLAAGETDRLTKSLVAVTGDAQEAGRQMERLRDIARAPGLGFSEAIQASVGLQAVGVDAATAERAIKEFGNALATTGGTKEDFAEVIRQFTQIQSLGKVTAENLNVIRERAPAVAGALQDAFAGVDLTTVPVENFNAVVLAELENLGRAAPSLLEPFVNAFDDVKAALVPLGTSIAQTLTPILQAAIPVIQSLSAAFAALSPETQRVIVIVGAAAIALGPLLIAFGAIVTAVGAALPLLGAAAVGFATLSAPVVLATGGLVAFAAAAYALRGGLAEMNAEAARSSGSLGNPFTETIRNAANAVDGFADRVPFLYRALTSLAPLGGFVRTLFDQFRTGADEAAAAFDRLGKARILSVGEDAFFDRIRATSAGGTGAGSPPPPAGPTPRGSLPTVDVIAPAVSAARQLAAALRDVETGAAASLRGVQTRIQDSVTFPLQAARDNVDALARAYDQALTTAGGNRSAVSDRLLAQTEAARVALTRLEASLRVVPEKERRASVPFSDLPDDTPRTTSAQIVDVRQITAAMRVANQVARDLADSLTDAFAGGVADASFALVETIFNGRAGLESLGDAVKGFASSAVSALRDVVASLVAAIAKAVILKGVLALANVILPGSGTLLGAGGSLFSTKAGPASLVPAVAPQVTYGRPVYSAGLRGILIPEDVIQQAAAGGASFLGESGRGV